MDLPVHEWAKEEGIAEPEIEERVREAADRKYAEKEEAYGAETMRHVEKSILLQILDQEWKDHLLQLDHLRQGINLRAYAQKDPLNEYKREAFELFDSMLMALREQVTTILMHVEIRMAPSQEELFARQMQEMHEGRMDPALAMAAMGAGDGEALPDGMVRASPLAGTPEDQPLPAEVMENTPRNAACPCGSGKKFKHCHGRMA